MLVDWFTVAAQLINFAILVWLLKRLLYKRVLKAMDERQERLLREAAEAKLERECARNEAEAYTKKLAKFEADYAERMKNSDDEIRRLRSEKVSEVRAELQQQRSDWMESLEEQRHDFLVELRKLIGNQVCDSARKLVRDLGDAPLEQQIVRHFADSLAEDSDRKTALNFDQMPDATIETTFPVEQETMAYVRTKLGPVLPADIQIEFTDDRSAPSLGVVFRAGNHRLEWSIDSYADQLTLNVERALFSEPSLASA